MVVKLAVLLAISLCSLKECNCGGTLENPKVDYLLCEQMIPPGMEDKEKGGSFHLYATAGHWNNEYLMITTFGGGYYTFIGIMLQVRVDNVPRGIFIQPPNLPGIRLNCPPQNWPNTWYSINFTERRCQGYGMWLPPQNYLNKNLTMHTTIIKDNNTYLQYVDPVPPNPTFTTTTTTTTTTTMGRPISISGEEWTEQALISNITR